MSFPSTYAAFRRTAGALPRTIEPSTEVLQVDLSSHEVLIRIHAVSLNFRDVGMLHGRYPVEVEDRGIPCSDCAAEVVKTGPAVEGISVGDHVSPICDLGNLTGNDDTPINALGGDTAGVLREYAVYEDRYLVKIPDYLSWEEVSIYPNLTCVIPHQFKFSIRAPRWLVLGLRLGLRSTHCLNRLKLAALSYKVRRPALLIRLISLTQDRHWWCKHVRSFTLRSCWSSVHNHVLF